MEHSHESLCNKVLSVSLSPTNCTPTAEIFRGGYWLCKIFYLNPRRRSDTAASPALTCVGSPGSPPEVAASDLIKIPRSDTKWGVDDEVTVTLEPHAQSACVYHRDSVCVRAQRLAERWFVSKDSEATQNEGGAFSDSARTVIRYAQKVPSACRQGS